MWVVNDSTASGTQAAIHFSRPPDPGFKDLAEDARQRILKASAELPLVVSRRALHKELGAIRQRLDSLNAETVRLREVCNQAASAGLGDRLVESHRQIREHDVQKPPIEDAIASVGAAIDRETTAMRHAHGKVAQVMATEEKKRLQDRRMELLREIEKAVSPYLGPLGEIDVALNRIHGCEVNGGLATSFVAFSALERHLSEAG
jgi:hypothetical protein